MNAAPSVNARTERLLAAPIVPTLARLSAPGVLLVAFQSLVSVGDTYFVGRLGTGPLAGLALVFPLLMLLQMTSAGAMGGGVSSAIARALGSGDAAAARRLVVHALVIAAAMGAAFSILVLLPAELIYELLGGRGETLEHALRYSSIVFGGAIVVWIANTLSSVLRGSGNMLTPALTLIGAALVHLPLSGILVSRIGIAGAGIAYVTTFGIAALVMGLIVRRSSLLSPRREDWKLEWRLFREILRVGAISAFGSSDGANRHNPYRLRRAPWRGGACRLRGRSATGTSADPAGIRGRPGARRARGHAHWRRPRGAREAHCLGRAGFAAHQPRDRVAVSIFRSPGWGSSAATPRCSSGSAPAPAVLPLLAAGIATSPRKARGACCGQYSPARCGWRS
jgi:hypothetical protein